MKTAWQIFCNTRVLAAVGRLNWGIFMESLIKSSLLYQGTKDKEDTSKHPSLDRSQPLRLWSICDISLILFGSVSPLGCWLWLYWRCWQGRGRGWRGGPSCQGWRPWGWGKRSRKQSQTDLNWINVYFLQSTAHHPIFRGIGPHYRLY